jgi:hypothetical protein
MFQLKDKTWIGEVILVPLILMFLSAGKTLAQSSTNYQVKNFVFDQGGGASHSTNHTVVDAVGQSSPVGEATSTNYIFSSGFWGGGEITYIDVAETGNNVTPKEFKLCQNYPNPFNPETSIEYNLPQTSEVVLTIYNLQGQVMRNLIHETMPAGYYTVHWNGQDEAGRLAASGIYFYRIEMKPTTAGQQSWTDVKKMLLMK